MKTIALLFTILLTLGFTAQAQTSIRFVDVDGHEKQITATYLAKLKRVTATASAHGQAGTFSGYNLGDVLTLAGVEFGEKLRGPRLASLLLVEAADGYQIVFALPELDPGFTDKQIILVDTHDGKPLTKDEGPYRLVVPDEKRPARWARQVTTFKIVSVATPRKVGNQ